MIAGAAFDLYVGQFTTGEVAQVCGVSRPVIDMWGTRGFIEPTRRERPIAGRLASTTKERRSRTSKGKPLFSARDMFKARLLQVLAAQLGIPVPRTFNPRTEADLEELYAYLPLALKPAVKENFFYATGAKAWRAETPDELNEVFRKAIQQIRPEEILIQEIIPGDGQRQYSYCAFFVMA